MADSASQGPALFLRTTGYSRWWPWLLALLLVAVLLAACGKDAIRAEPTEVAPTATPTPTPRPLGRFPEYQIEARLDPAMRQVTGYQVLLFPNHTGQVLEELVFRLYPNLPQYGGQMTVGDVRVDGEVVATSLRAEGTSLAVALPHPLAPETGVEVKLAYQVEIPVKEAGYALFAVSQGVWSVPDAYPLLAVYDGTAWHEDVAPSHGDAVFADAALYDVTLAIPQELTVAATGIVVDEGVTQDGARRYRVTGGPFREFTWLASADYQVVETMVDDIRLCSYYLPGDQAAGETALGVSAAALRVYQESYGEYPFDHMDVVEAPLLHFGMEYTGLNLIGIDLYRSHQTELEDRVVHEIAHQWWYAQVGNDQVNAPWLDEGLAEYSMAVYYGKVLGEAQANTLVNQRWLVPYQVAVENDYDAVVNQPSSAFTWEYEVIVYAKAALFFDALRQELGDPLFFDVLRAYVDRYRWSVANPEDFLAVAESVSGRDLDELYARWILSTH
jgi:hypothetical protein